MGRLCPHIYKKNTGVSAEAMLPGSRHHKYLLRTFLAAYMVAQGALVLCYTAISLYVARRVAFAHPKDFTETPADVGLMYRDVSFFSREHHRLLSGWFIPGVLPDGRLTTERTIIMVHGSRSNRTAPEARMLDLIAALVRHGFAILAFDMRGQGRSAPAAHSMGYFEQFDILSAVDFLNAGPLPFPELGRPRAIGGWGLSMGGAAMILASVQEPAIRGIVTDCAFAALVPLVESRSKVARVFIPGVAKAMRLLYGIDYHAVRPVDVVARIAPRPLFFIQGEADTLVPPWNMQTLAVAASKRPDAHVQTWLIPNAAHIESYRVMGSEYVCRVVAFFTAALTPECNTGNATFLSQKPR